MDVKKALKKFIDIKALQVGTTIFKNIEETI